MRIFVTGASGYIGHATAQAFRAKGHTVYGLVRNQKDATILQKEEIRPVIGDLDQPDSYRKILKEMEVAVHCAFDLTKNGVELDLKTIDTILDSFSKSSLPHSFIYTSGAWVYGSKRDKMVDESTSINPIEIVKWRPSHEKKVLKATTPNLRTVIMRPGVVFGGIEGLMALFFNSIQKGSVSIVGEGHNRWPMVHVRDLAHAYVSAAEKELTHVVLNVADDSTATVREMAEALAKAVNIEGKIHQLSHEEAQKQFGPLVQGLTVDLTLDNSRIKRLLGWQIHHAPFVYEAETYYQAWKANQ